MITKKYLEGYGMPEMYHEGLLKGKKVETLSGTYKIIKGDLIRTESINQSIKEEQ